MYKNGKSQSVLFLQSSHIQSLRAGLELSLCVFGNTMLEASPVKPETTNMYSVMLKTDFKSLDYNSTLNSLENL